MNKNIKSAILAISLLYGMMLPAKGQQNIQFTQYIFNTLSVNPAYAGYKEEWFAQLALRNQWVNMPGNPKTGQVSIDGLLDPYTKNNGVGLQITADKLGPQAATSIYGNYSYRLRLNTEDSKRLSFGVGVGVTQYSLDGSLVDVHDGGDLGLPAGKISSFIPDVRFGVYYYTNKWYAGASVMDLLSGDNSNNIFRWDSNTTGNIRRKRHLYLIAGTLHKLDRNTMFKPSILIKEDFNGPTTFDFNAMFIFNSRLWLGASYRNGFAIWNKDYTRNQSLNVNNALAGIIQMYVSERLRIGYSYDYSISKLSTVQNGTHELTLGFTFPPKGNRIISPRFF
ncbi:type IX secretion system membrane protein PorP/SprF [Olivibacter sp. SA151]|uniref:PorP/SprF family type IX secretion system membrane protein n=1 Tax=Olivibacter jilunii TaxID=985016 RepID=UPI003F15FE99